MEGAGILEGFITLVIVGGAMVIGIALIAGISRLICKIDDRHIARKRKATIAAVKLFRMVDQHVGSNLSEAEYDHAIRYTIHKYHLEDHNGAMDFSGQDIEYISVLITETVNQNRIFQGTLAIAQADAELAANNQIEQQEELTA